jgi:hypothetical protein
MEDSDVIQLFGTDFLQKLEGLVCDRCQRVLGRVEELKIAQDETGLCQWYECPQYHKVCALCICNQSSRPVGEEQKRIGYPLLRCLKCQNKRSEYATVHVHEKHCFDLFHVLLQHYFMRLMKKSADNSALGMLECMDIECQPAGKKQLFHPMLLSVIDQLMPEYTLEVLQPITPEQIPTLNIYLYRYLTVIIEVTMKNNPLNNLPACYAKVRGYIGCKEGFVTPQLDAISNVLADLDKCFPPRWLKDKNLLDSVFLRPMQAQDEDWQAAAGLLAKCSPTAKLQEGYAIQNAKQWSMYTLAKATIKTEKLLATDVALANPKELCSTYSLPLSLPRLRDQGRAVYLAESALGHKFATNIEGNFWSLYSLVALGTKAPPPAPAPVPATEFPPTNLTYENNFQRYHQLEDQEDGLPRCVVYNLAQIYPQYLVRYTIP